MTPVSPVLIAPGVLLPKALAETVFAKDQEQYHSLPALVCNIQPGRITTRWRLTVRERLRLLWTGNLYLQALTFNRPLQPQKPMICEPTVEECL